MQSIMDSKKIPYTPIDIAADENARLKMVAAMKAANKPAPYIAPQLFYGDEYIGVRFLLS